MDILGEYERQNPVAPVRSTSFRSDSEYGFFIKLVMRLSGGKIENGRQASLVLLAVAGAILLTSISIFISTSGLFSSRSTGMPAPIAGPEDPRFRNQQQP
jgi:hypothetical protein